MASQILLRNIPDDVSQWIETERKKSKMSQREFLLSLLTSSAEVDKKNQERVASHPHTKKTADFTFIDLFAGIGGFRIALEKLGGECVFTSEWDKYAQKTYRMWFGEEPHGDIREIKPSSIPNHDVLVAGFPCQPFSIAGVSKKNSLGRAHGFDDLKQGNLFFYLAEIIKEKRPAALLLENVKNLKSHDGGNTWKVIEQTLRDLDYTVDNRIYDAAHWVPQHRERVFIVGFDARRFGTDSPFKFPEPPKKENRLIDILEETVEEKYTLTPNLWNYLQRYADKHKAAGNGFGFGMPDLNGVSRTLSARYHKDGSEILIRQDNKRAPRRLTPRECARLMGFPDKYPIVVSDTQAYRQFGNGVVVPVAHAVGKAVISHLRTQKATKPRKSK